MTTLDWIIMSVVWMLIPAMVALKAWRDSQTGRVCRETQPDIDRGLAELSKQLGGKRGS